MFDELFYILFSYQVFEIRCVFYTSGTTQFRRATSEVLMSPTWPVVTTCDMSDLESCKTRVMWKQWGERSFESGRPVKSSVLGITERGGSKLWLQGQKRILPSAACAGMSLCGKVRVSPEGDGSHSKMWCKYASHRRRAERMPCAGGTRGSAVCVERRRRKL